MNPCQVSIRVMLSTGVIAGVFSLPLQAGSGAPAVGEEAPAFELPGSDGETYSRADYRGEKVVVLAWFPKAFTGG
jgi:peroxiredoxin Q/BCP